MLPKLALPGNSPGRTRVFVVLDTYLPGFKSGGPLRTIANMIDRLDKLSFFIFTRDRDVGSGMPFTEVSINAWNNIGNAKVFYSKRTGLGAIRRQILAAKPDLLYLNSFFSYTTIKVLLLRRAGLIPRLPAILAPRGECSPGGLRLKPFKKRVYLALAPPLLYRDLLWQASSDLEKSEIEQALGTGLRVRVATDLPPRKVSLPPQSKQPKRSGAATFVYLSRISEKKNLHFLLALLSRIKGEVELQIWGPVEDQKYWNRCEQLIRSLPDNIRTMVKGPVQHERVSEVLGQCHFFVLPTLSENFGHAILEAWMSGCPVLISDQTPWRGLRTANTGWDIALTQVELWCEALQDCVDMDTSTFARLSESSRQYAMTWISSSSIDRANYAIFEEALGKPLNLAAHVIW
jgi:glycosyltransferase involved in cell wall biosynthesis